MSKSEGWTGKALTILFASISLMIAIPSVYLRAIISILLLLALVRLEGESLNLNLGTIKGSLQASFMALALTLTLLPISEVRLAGAKPLTLFQALTFQLAVSTWEEIVFRGYPLLRFSKTLLISSSLAFSLIHAFNPGFGIQAFFGLLLAGLLLGILRYYFGLLPSISFHLTWNFLIEHVWGFPNSGIRDQSIFISEIGGSELISGGLFGPEASLIFMVEISIFLLILLFKRLVDAGDRI